MDTLHGRVVDTAQTTKTFDAKSLAEVAQPVAPDAQREFEMIADGAGKEVAYRAGRKMETANEGGEQISPEAGPLRPSASNSAAARSDVGRENSGRASGFVEAKAATADTPQVASTALEATQKTTAWNR
eukprot:g7365.t1